MPIKAKSSHVYVNSVGEDSLASKGVVSARLTIPDQNVAMYIFLTHLQAPKAVFGKNEEAAQVIKCQLDELCHFVSTQRAHRPALLMGDFNTNANDKGLYKDLLKRLGNPKDLWEGRSVPKGYTFPSENFYSVTGIVSKLIKFLSRNGRRRIDYFFSYPGNRTSMYQNTCRLELKTCQESQARKRSISDHYGLVTELCAI